MIVGIVLVFLDSCLFDLVCHQFLLLCMLVAVVLVVEVVHCTWSILKIVVVVDETRLGSRVGSDCDVILLLFLVADTIRRSWIAER